MHCIYSTTTRVGIPPKKREKKKGKEKPETKARLYLNKRRQQKASNI
jgi:hypothetical protein